MGSLERLAKWVARRPAVSALLAVVLLLVAVGFPLVTWKWREALHNEQRAQENEQKATDQLQRAETALYVNRVARAYALWKDNDIERARRLLDECPAELRGWEWNYLNRLCDDSLLTLTGVNRRQSTDVFVAFSPDGRLLASARAALAPDHWDNDLLGEIHLWDVRTGQQGVVLQGEAARVSGNVAFSPDGKLLVAAGGLPSQSEEKPAQYALAWDVQTGQEAFSVRVPYLVNWERSKAVAFSPDGRFLAVATDLRVFLCEAGTGKMVRQLEGGGSSLSFSPDGRLLASAGSGLRIWTVDTGKEYVPSVNPDPEARQNVRGVAFSPDGRRFLTWKQKIQIWDTATGAELGSLTSSMGDVSRAVWSPDGRSIAAPSSDRSVKVFDADDGRELFALRGHIRMVWDVAFSPDGSVLASLSADETIRLWDFTRGQEVHTRTEGALRKARLHGLTLSSDGKRIGLVFEDGPQPSPLVVQVCDADTGRDFLPRTELDNPGDGRPVALALSPNGAFVAVVRKNTVRLWDVATGRELPALEAASEIRQVIFSPNANTLALVHLDRVSLRALADGHETASFASYPSILGQAPAVAFSPNGSLAALASPSHEHSDPELLLVDTASGNVVRRMTGSDAEPFRTPRYTALAFSSDGRRLLVYGNQRVSVLDVDSGRLLYANATGNEGLAVFSPDGSRLATALGPQPMEVSLWDTTSGQEMFVIKSYSRTGRNSPEALIWSSDGSAVAVADEVGDVRYWTATSRTDEVRAARRAAWPEYALDWHRRAARDHEREPHGFAAAFHLSRLIEANPADGTLFLRRGLANAQAERWAEAADNVGKAIELGCPDTFETRYRHALLLRKKGDLPGFRVAVALLLERWGNTTDGRIARRLVELCLLDGEKAVDRKVVEHLVQVMLTEIRFTAITRVVDPDHSDFSRTYADLRARLNAAAEKHEDAKLVWLFAPLLCERLGDPYDADFWLARATRQLAAGQAYALENRERKSTKPTISTMDWEVEATHELLRQEIDVLRKKAGH